MMPLKGLSVRQSCSLWYNICSWSQVLPSMSKWIRLLLCADHPFFSLIMFARKFLHDRGMFFIASMTQIPQLFQKTEIGVETERSAKIETMFKSFDSIWYIYVWQTALAQDERIFQTNQALDRLSQHIPQLWHILDYNLYANIWHIAPFMGLRERWWKTVLTL